MITPSHPGPLTSRVTPGLPRLSEPDTEACVGLLYRLLTDEHGYGNTTSRDLGGWELRRSLLLADYARRSVNLPFGIRARLDARIVESFAASSRRPEWTQLGEELPTAETCDVAILTILREELEATVAAFDADARPRRVHGQPVHTAQIACANRPEGTLSVTITRAAKPLNVHTQIPAIRVRDRYKPLAMFLVGIAAGLPHKFNIGDVVVPKKVFYYEAERMSEGGINPRPQYVEPADPYLAGFDAYDPYTFGYLAKVQSFLADMPAHRKPQSVPIDFKPKIVSENATIAAGEKVLRDGRYLDELRNRFDDTICAADQESYGFAVAAQGLPWLVFRGISDHGDGERHDDWKYAAAGMAALCLRNFLEHSYVPPDASDL